MSTKRSNGNNEDPEKESKDDLRRGILLLIVFISLLCLLGAVYIWVHAQWPAGPFSAKASTTALDFIDDAQSTLEAKKNEELAQEDIGYLTDVSGDLALLAPQIGASNIYSTTLQVIDTKLASQPVRRVVLISLFHRLENIIRVGTGSYFWPGSPDRWIELAFWTVIGTLMFLLSEIKKYASQPYKNKREFIKFTPWYFVNLFRGPFIALVILLGLKSISFTVLGVSIDFTKAPFEVEIVVAAILGYYSRVADKQLEIIAEYLLTNAWKKAYREEAEEENTSQSIVVSTGESSIDDKRSQTASDLKLVRESLNVDIVYMMGVTADYAQKLKKAGIFTPHDLLVAGSTSKGRDKIAKRTGFSRELILQLVNRCDLMRIRGVGSEYAALLEAAGVGTMANLAASDPSDVYQRLLEKNLENRERRVLVQSQVEDWVAQAKQQSRVIMDDPPYRRHLLDGRQKGG